MKRDMDKVRELLLALEASPDTLFMANEIIELANCEDTNEALGYLLMLESAGYLESSQKSVYRLSWSAHEFLDTIRDPEIWRKTKEGASKVGSWSVKLLADLGTGFIRAKAVELGLPIGP